MREAEKTEFSVKRAEIRMIWIYGGLYDSECDI